MKAVNLELSEKSVNIFQNRLGTLVSTALWGQKK